MSRDGKIFQLLPSTFFSITLTETAESYTWYFADNLQSFWAYNFGFSQKVFVTEFLFS